MTLIMIYDQNYKFQNFAANLKIGQFKTMIYD